MPRSNEAKVLAPEEIVEFTRVFDAPRALVFKLWSAPEHRARWWGPDGFALKENELEFREGGAWRVVMLHVSGYEHVVSGVFREIEEPSRLSFTYINSTERYETLVTMDFVELGDKTEMHFRQAPFATIEARDAHAWGWKSSFDLMAAYAPQVSPVDAAPVGPPRIEGTAPDIVAARKRHEHELTHGFEGKWNPGDPR